MTSSRQLIVDSLNHRQPARVPIDFGGSPCSGIHCSVVAALRDHFGLEKRLVKIHEPFQMLGYIEDDLRKAMGVDAVIAMPLATMIGNPLNDRWTEWKTPWGQKVLVPETMRVDPAPDGGALIYPQGDKSVAPSAKMPASGYFFDAIIRQQPFDEDDPDPADNLEEFTPLADADIASLAESAKAARATGLAVIAGMPGTGLGDIALVPGMHMKRPKGIRDVAEWYMSTVSRQEFMHKVFASQTEVALDNLARVHKAVGDAYDVAFVCGADFGTQTSTFCSPSTFESLYVPYYSKVNSWIHENTSWKTLKHCCGAAESLLELMIASGFDILNPVQCSATGMDPKHLKDKYGSRLTFWGGGVDTQKTLPFGTPAEVREEVLGRCRIFSPGGGFVFNAIHNVQANTPTANVIAMLDAVNEFNAAGR